MSYIIELRKALDEAGFADTKIVAPDLNKAAAEAFIQQWLAELGRQAARCDERPTHSGFTIPTR